MKRVVPAVLSRAVADPRGRSSRRCREAMIVPERRRLARRAAIAVVVLAAAWLARGQLVELLTYGVTWDERPQFKGLRDQVGVARMVWSGQEVDSAEAILGLKEYYGIVNKLPGLVLWRAGQSLAGRPVSGWDFDDLAIASFHLSSWLFTVLALWSCLGLARLWLGRTPAAWLAPLLLVLSPRFVGHGFFNIKDIPFAAIYTAASVAMAATLVAPDARSRRARVAMSVVLGGMLAGIKAPGFVALWPLAAAGLFAKRLRLPLGAAERAAWILAPPGALLIGMLSTPAAWPAPVTWLEGALAIFSSYVWGACTMTWGECLVATDLPRTYLPLWFAVTTPAVVLFAFACGLFVVARRGVQLVAERGALDEASRQFWLVATVVGAQVFTFALLAVARRAVIYDGERHFLFVVPAACVVGALGLSSLFDRMRQSAPPLRLAVAGVLVAAAAGVVVDTVRLHPYEYAYYNEAGRHLDPTFNFETDYWSFGLAELVRREEAREHADPARSNIPLAGFPTNVFDIYRRASVSYPDAVARPIARHTHFPGPVRVAALNRFEWRRTPGGCRVEDTIERRLLLASQPLVMDRIYLCGAGDGASASAPGGSVGTDGAGAAARP